MANLLDVIVVGEEERGEDKDSAPEDPLRRRFPELYASDTSLHPSYTQLAIPYSAVCRQRFGLMRLLYLKQLRGELVRMATCRPRALLAVRTWRVFSHGVIARKDDCRDPLTHAERSRLEDLLNDRPVFLERKLPRSKCQSRRFAHVGHRFDDQ